MDYDKEFTVFVGNLNEKVTKDLLFEIFFQMGPIVNCAIVNPNRNTNNKNNEKNNSNNTEDFEKVHENEKYFRFGFVVFEHADSVPFACKMLNDISLYGDKLVIRPRSRIEQKECLPEVKTNTCSIDPVRREKPKGYVSKTNQTNIPTEKKIPARNSKVFYNSQYRSFFSHSFPELIIPKSPPVRENERRSICEYKNFPKFIKRTKMTLVKS